MNKIALYGKSQRILNLFHKMKDDTNVDVEILIDTEKKLTNTGELKWKTIIYDLAQLKDYKEKIFAIINIDNDQGLAEKLKSINLDNIKIISGTSADFLYRGQEDQKSDLMMISSELKNIADNLSLLFDKEKLLDEILRFLCDKTGANRGSIMLFDKKEKVLKVAMAYGIDRVLWDFIKTPLGEGIAGKVLENKEPIIISGSPDDKTFKKIRKREDIKSAICVPLLKDTEAVGVINLSSNSDINAFSEKDLDFLKGVTDVIGNILFASKKFTEFKEDSERYKIFSEISQILSLKLPIYDRVVKIIEYILDNFSIYTSVIMFSDVYGFEVVATNYPVYETSDIISENTIENWVYKNKKEVIFLEPEKDFFRGYAAFPLLADNNCFGIISFINYQNYGVISIDFLKDLVVNLSQLLSLVYHKEEMAEQSRFRDFTEELTAELSLMEDKESFFNYLLKRLSDELSCLISFVRVYDEEKKAYIVKDCIGYENIVSKDFFQIDRELTKRVLKSKTPLYVKNTIKDKDYSYLSPNLSTFIIYPFMVNSDIEACFSFYNKKGSLGKRAFSTKDLKILQDIFSKSLLVFQDLSRKLATSFENYTDIITGLPNFRYFEKRVYEEIARAKRHNKRVVLLVIELQNYVRYLEAYGKKFTDEIIKKISLELREKIRSFEVVARLNDNKFGIILVDADEKALEVIFRLKKVFDKMAFDPKNLLKDDVNIKFGYSRYPDDGEEYDELIVKANHIRG